MVIIVTVLVGISILVIVVFISADSFILITLQYNSVSTYFGFVPTNLSPSGVGYKRGLVSVT